MSNQTQNPPYTQQEIEYFTHKFNLTSEQVKQAIQKVGNSSENLEQYFSEQDTLQQAGNTGKATADFSQQDLKGKKVDAFPDTEEDKPLDQSTH